jgi:plasmid replication initiation protein
MKKEKPVWNANQYIQLRKSFTVLQKRVLHFVVKQLQDEMFNLNEQKAQGKKIERTLFGDCYFHIPANAIDPLNQDTEIRRALKGFKIPIDDDDFIGDFMLSAKREKGSWRLLFPEKSVHFLTEISKGVTPLQTVVYLSAKSIYTIRLYELLMQYRDTGKWYVTPEDLGDMLGVPNSYKKDYGLLRTKSIEPADKELRELFKKNQSEIHFILEEERGGRGNKVNRLVFKIISSEKEKSRSAKQEKEDYEFIAFRLNAIMLDDSRIQKKMKVANKKFVDMALSKIVERGKIKHFADKLNWVLENGQIEEKGAYLRKVLTEEYGVDTK